MNVDSAGKCGRILSAELKSGYCIDGFESGLVTDMPGKLKYVTLIRVGIKIGNLALYFIQQIDM